MAHWNRLIREACIVDGAGNPWFVGDCALSGDRIAVVASGGTLDPRSAEEVIEARDKVLCPGFIDIQSHSIIPLMRDGRCVSKISQGVTTEIMGESWTPAPAGGRLVDPLATPMALKGSFDVSEWEERACSWHRFRDWLEAMVRHGVSPNIGSFLSGSVVRQHGKGMDMGPANEEELNVMRRVVREAMEDGAFGVSYALIYPPDAYASTEEVIAVCQAMAEYGGLYITHMRSEADGLLEGLDEALRIGQEAGVPVEIYHLKAWGERNWSKMETAISRIDSARAGGQDVTACMYPYVASGTGLSAILPPWASSGAGLRAKLADPASRAAIRAAVLEPSGDWEAKLSQCGASNVMPVGFACPENRRYGGMRLDAIARERHQEPIDAALDLLAAESSRIFTLYFSMSEDNLVRQMRMPWIKFASDAGGVDPVWAAPEGLAHPRAYGTFPRILGRYVREEGVLRLEEAIRMMTSAVAARLGLNDRGLVRPGMKADLVLFDPEQISDNASYEHPHRLATGVDAVWVNGSLVWRDGVHTGATPGEVVTRNPSA